MYMKYAQQHSITVMIGCLVIMVIARLLGMPLAKSMVRKMHNVYDTWKTKV